MALLLCGCDVSVTRVLLLVLELLFTSLTMTGKVIELLFLWLVWSVLLVCVVVSGLE